MSYLCTKISPKEGFDIIIYIWDYYKKDVLNTPFRRSSWHKGFTLISAK